MAGTIYPEIPCKKCGYTWPGLCPHHHDGGWSVDDKATYRYLRKPTQHSTSYGDSHEPRPKVPHDEAHRAVLMNDAQNVGGGYKNQYMAQREKEEKDKLEDMKRRMKEASRKAKQQHTNTEELD